MKRVLEYKRIKYSGILRYKKSPNPGQETKPRVN